MKPNKRFPVEIKWLLLYIFCLPIPAIVVNVFLICLPIPTSTSLASSDWLGFWGSFLGGAIGCIPAIIAINESRKDAKRQHKELQTDRRLSVMPVFDCQIEVISQERSKTEDPHIGYLFIDCEGVLRNPTYDEVLEFDCYYIVNRLKISNCGHGPALQTAISFDNSSVDIHLQNSGSTDQYLFFYSSRFLQSYSDNSHIELSLSFTDIFGNRYTQTHTFYYYFSDNYVVKFRTIAIGQPILRENG